MEYVQKVKSWSEHRRVSKSSFWQGATVVVFVVLAVLVFEVLAIRAVLTLVR